MAEGCPLHFDQPLLSGYLDGELRQYDEQRVRNHLEDCAQCRAVHDQLMELREAAMTTRFEEPDDEQWCEAPRGVLSRGAFGLGWLVLIIWVLAVSAFGGWQLWQSPADMLSKLLVFGGVSGIALLFVSALVDRLHTFKTDPYREVKK